MHTTTRQSANTIAVMTFALVVTQITYFALSSGGADINRPVIWTTEAVAFLTLSVLALHCLVRAPHNGLAWAAIALSGTLNVIQVGMGLAMFGPLSDAGDAMAPAFKAVLAGAFFLFFTGKALFGFAALVMGSHLLRGSTATKALGGLTAIAGLAAMGLNVAAMAIGMDLVFPAGASGTVATLMLGIAIIVAARGQD